MNYESMGKEELIKLLTKRDTEIIRLESLSSINAGEKKVLEDENRSLRYYAAHDRLTGCIRKDFMDDHVTKALKGRRLGDSPCSLVYVDIDAFKQFNDTFGHAFGDSVLKGVAEKIKESLRHGDIVSRGDNGDEFIIFLNSANKDEAEDLMSKISQSISLMGFSNDEIRSAVNVSISYGIAERSQSYSRFETLAAAADKDMYDRRAVVRNK